MKLSKIHNLTVSFFLNFLPVIFSLLVMQIVVLPDLYSENVEQYLQFNYLLYAALLFIHVFNTACFNEQVIRYKMSYSDALFKFDLSTFGFFFVLYTCSIYIFSILYGLNYEVLLFLLFLYPADFSVNALRLIEKDKTISSVLFLQAFLFGVFYKFNILSVFSSYTLANIISLLIFLFAIRYDKFTFLKLRFSLDKIKSLVSIAVPTLNRYVDKLFVLSFFTVSFKSLIFPFLSLSGLLLLPISVASKVIIRSVDYSSISIRKYFYYIFLSMPILFLLIFTINYWGAQYIYEINSMPSMYLLLSISAFKSANLIEIITFAIFSNRINIDSFYSGLSRLVSFFMFLAILIGFILDIEFPDYLFLLVGVYFFVSMFLQLTNILKGKVR